MCALKELFRETVLFVGGTTAEPKEEDTRRLSAQLRKIIEAGRNHGVLFIIPRNRKGYWSLTITEIVKNTAKITACDLVQDGSEAEREVVETKAFLQGLLGDAPGNLYGLPPVPEWPSFVTNCLKQVESSDCGVAVIVHILGALAGVLPPDSTDWLLWRRLIAAFFMAYRQLPEKGRDTRSFLSKLHNAALTAV